MEKIVNEYGTVYKTVEAESLRGRWSGNFYINPSKELKDLTREEYEFAFPEAVNYGKFMKYMENPELKLPIYALYGVDTKDMVELLVNDKYLLAYKTPNEAFEMDIDSDIKVEVKNYEGVYELPFDSLPENSKDSIYIEIGIGDSSGKIVDSVEIDNYIIPGIERPIEVEGRIEKIMYLYEKGKICNTKALKAALYDAGEVDKLREVEKETNTLISEMNRAKTKQGFLKVENKETRIDIVR